VAGFFKSPLREKKAAGAGGSIIGTLFGKAGSRGDIKFNYREVGYEASESVLAYVCGGRAFIEPGFGERLF
jgi:hypothetical protein